MTQTLRALLLLSLSLLPSVGCRIAGHESRRLLHAQPSAEALAQKVLEALARRDDQSLKDLVVTKDEFCQYIWPELPSSQTPNLTCEWVWNSFAPSDHAGRRQTLAAHGGNHYSFVRLRFAKAAAEYETFTAHEEARVIVRDDAGKETELKLFGSILELHGQFKLFSFIVD